MASVLLIDVDGTLIDSFPGIRDTLEKTLAEIGWPMPTEEMLARLPGPPLEVTFRGYGMRGDVLDTALDTFRRHYTATGWSNSSLFPGWAQGLARWKEDGLTLCTATSKSISHASTMVEHLGVRPYFDFLGAASDDGARKTKAEVIEYVLETQDLDPMRDNILMIGDRSHDTDGASQFGIPTALVGWGHGTREEWDAVDYFARDFNDLERVVRGFANLR